MNTLLFSRLGSSLIGELMTELVNLKKEEKLKAENLLKERTVKQQPKTEVVPGSQVSIPASTGKVTEVDQELPRFERPVEPL